MRTVQLCNSQPGTDEASFPQRSMASAVQDILARLIQCKPRFAGNPLRWESKDAILPDLSRRPEHLILLNDLEFFESEFLHLCQTDPNTFRDAKLSDQHMKHLCELLEFLNDIVNGDLLNSAGLNENLAECRGDWLQLEKLLVILNTAPGRFDLVGATERSLFSIKTPYRGRNARLLIEKVNTCAYRSQPHVDRSARTTTTYQRSYDKTTNDTSYLIGIERQRFFDRLLHSLESDFGDCNTSNHGEHSVMVQLPGTHHTDPDSGVDAFIRCPRPRSWQGVKYKPETEVQIVPLRTRVLCDYIEYSSKIKEKLMLYFDASSRSYRKSEGYIKGSLADPNTCPMKSLQELIDVDGVFNPPFQAPPTAKPWNYTERRALAAKLAYGLTTMHSKQHELRPWNGSDIQFVGLPDCTYDKDSPFLTCFVGKKPESTIDVIDELEPVQALTDFAQLLLEIEYGPLPTRKRKADNSTTETQNYGAVASTEEEEPENHTPCGGLAVRRSSSHPQIRDQYRANFDHKATKYLEAVDACLRFNEIYFNERIKLSELGIPEEETRTRLIHREIMAKIETDAPTGRRAPPRNRLPVKNTYMAEEEIKTSRVIPSVFESRSSKSNNSRLSTVALAPKASNDSNRFRTPPRVPAKSSKAVRFAMITHNFETSKGTGAEQMISASTSTRVTSRTSFSTLDLDVVQLFSLHLADVQNPSKCRDTDSWVKDFKIQRFNLSIGRDRETRIKIAILDTGIDVGHPRVQSQFGDTGRIRGYKDFLGGAAPMDLSGHGTHIAGVIIDLTSNTDLYIARVIESQKHAAKKHSTVRSNIVEALEHARLVWKVDMISMSFGFNKTGPLDGVRKQVHLCLNDGIAVFASASNDGGHRPRTYPGFYSRVLCIHSASGAGAASDFNPSPMTDEDNFMAVGEYINSWWPIVTATTLQEADSDQKRMSGTSFATPVAVSIAAFMIGYIRKNLSQYRWNVDPLSPEGIQKIFRLLSQENKRGGYNFLSTRWLFETRGEDLTKSLLIKELDGHVVLQPSKS